jgi:NitT/TauT family transport system substrate-binding protein
MTAITLQEPFRAVFYAPFYAALARGDFAREGLDVTLAPGGDPENAMHSLLNGTADLAWSGPMRMIREHALDPACPLVSFGAVVMGDPFLLVGRGARPDFTLADLTRLSLGVVSEVPTPWWCLQHDLRQIGIDPASLRGVMGRTMAENADAVAAGTLDVAQLFEPFVSRLEARGGVVWHAQAARGLTSYTAFYATKETLRTRREPIRGMLRGIAAMQRWLVAASAAEVAETVAPHFEDIERDVLERCIARYQSLGIWAATPHFPRAAFEMLEAAMFEAGAVARKPGFEACVDTSIEAEAMA